MNIAHVIEQGQHTAPDKLAVVFEDCRYTYRMLNTAASRAANGLAALGVQAGDRVALFLPNIPAFIIAYLGIQKLGAVAVSLNVMLKRDEITFLLNDSGAIVVITDATLSPQLALDDLPHVKHVLIAEGDADDGSLFSRLLEQSSPHYQAIDCAAHHPAAIIYTSGTTGFPKGAVLTHGNVTSNIAAKRHYCGMQRNDRLLLFVPLFHCFGQNAILLSGLSAGATIVLMRRFVLDQVLQVIHEHQVTMFFGVPTTYRTFLNNAVPSSLLQSVRYYLSAAAVLSETLARTWVETYGSIINEGYGLTETSPFACYNHKYHYKYGSIGTPIEDVAMRIVDPAGQPLAPNEPGEIVIRGPNVMLGYWNNPDATQQVLRNGWFHTGDIGIVDAEGYFFLRDRIKDMINVSGFKVFSAEVERVLGNYPGIAEVAVYGVADAVRGEQVNAAVVLQPNYSPDCEAILQFCRFHLAAYQVPTAITFVTSLPKTPSGKVQKHVLRETAQRAIPD